MIDERIEEREQNERILQDEVHLEFFVFRFAFCVLRFLFFFVFSCFVFLSCFVFRFRCGFSFFVLRFKFSVFSF